jgi:hypothetical protein
MAVPAPGRASLLARRTNLAAAPPMGAGRTLVDLFFDRAAHWSERPALRHMDGGVIDRFRDLVEEMYAR